MDRNHSLWVGTQSQGLYRIHDGVADHYGSANGLSGDTVRAIYEDKEGNLWVTTDRGVDMFRDLPVVTFSTTDGLIGSDVDSVLALSNGSVWVGNIGAVDIVRAGHVSAIAAGHGLPGQNVESSVPRPYRTNLARNRQHINDLQTRPLFSDQEFRRNPLREFAGPLTVSLRMLKAISGH